MTRWPVGNGLCAVPSITIDPTRTAAERRGGRSLQRGTSTLEVLVAFALLSTVLALSTPLVVQHRRLLAAHRDYRLALDELSNQLERLTVLSEDELSKSLESLQPSSFAAERLPGAKLSGQLDSADIGQRLTLRLSWHEPQRSTAPVVLAAWIVRPLPNNQSERSEQP